MDTQSHLLEELHKPLSKSGFFFARSFLHLQDDSVYEGFAPEYQQGAFSGEVVFTTGMTGYDAALTDPSYVGQILVFTYPLIGNYGVPAPDCWESEKIHVAGVVISDACFGWSHERSTQSLLAWLKHSGIPVLIGIDTRQLTKKLREKGTILGAISSSPDSPSCYTSIDHEALVSRVNIPEPIVIGNGSKKLIAVDCGMKQNILRNFEKYDLSIYRVPADFDYTNLDFDGIFLSNGPGNPASYTKTIEILKQAMKKEKPIFGICLGAQLLALAAGASTYKMRYGHRGLNQPCIDVETKRCFITSQNHGYAVMEESLPEGWKVSFRNLNDGTVEGIVHETLPFSAVQFHPEAAPGSTEAEWMFETFTNQLS